MRARLNGITIARKLLRKSGLPIVDATLGAYGLGNTVDIASVK
jgi:hypothetical protein